MKILVVTDAWHPQVNGVVRTLSTVANELRHMGHDVSVIGPHRFRTIPCPTYPDIQLAYDAGGKLPGMIEAYRPDAIHISTEGPLGFTARRHCRRKDVTPSPPPITRSFPNISRRARASRRPGPTGSCAGFTARRSG